MSNQPIVITVGTDGATQGLYDGKMNLKSLGNQQVDRATDIHHNNDTQMFDVYLLPDRELVLSARHFVEYEDARKFEVTWLNLCRLAETTPNSELGETLASIARVFNNALLLTVGDIEGLRTSLVISLNSLVGEKPWKSLLGLGD